MVDLFELLIGKEGDRDYKKKPVIVQGITGKFGSFHTQQMLVNFGERQLCFPKNRSQTKNRV